jgi:AAA domain, putative AbiEii toxin, Type IV TA system/Protein of unknown function (DUF4435)
MHILRIQNLRNEQIQLDVSQGAVFVGANGSGKTRLGFQIENLYRDTSTRISAQRLLTLPPETVLRGLTQALALHSGGNTTILQAAGGGYQVLNRTSHEAVYAAISDFDSAMAVLFASENDFNARFRRSALLQDEKSPIDQVNSIWTTIFPHLTLTLNSLDGRIGAKNSLGHEFEARQMSDGERAALYLIVQFITAKKNHLMIVDEPERHLHRALVAKIFNLLVKARKDLKLVIITHDLDFALIAPVGKKFWIRAHQSGQWNFEELTDTWNLQPALLLELLGSRRTVLVTEGTRSILDVQLFGKVFPNFSVIGGGSCEDVIKIVKATKSVGPLSHLNVVGLIDRDTRTPSEIEDLGKSGIFVHLAAEVENIFCSKPAIHELLQHDGFPNIPNAVLQIENKMTDYLEQQNGTYKIDQEKRRIVRAIDGLSSKRFSSPLEFAEAVSSIVEDTPSPDTDIDEPGTYSSWEICLRRFGHKKALCALVAPITNRSSADSLIDQVFNLLERVSPDKMRRALLQAIPVDLESLHISCIVDGDSVGQ